MQIWKGFREECSARFDINIIFMGKFEIVLKEKTKQDGYMTIMYCDIFLLRKSEVQLKFIFIREAKLNDFLNNWF